MRPVARRRLRFPLLAALVAALLIAPVDSAIAATQDCRVRVSGRIVDVYTAEPLRGWTVVDPAVQGSFDRTDAQGRYAFTTCASSRSDRHQLFFRAPAPGPVRTKAREFGFPARGTEVRLGTTKVGRPSAIAGRLLDAEGKPVVGAVVRAYTSRGAEVRFSGSSDAGTTDAKGYFWLLGAKPGTYRIGVTLDFWREFGVRRNTASASFFWSSSGPTSSFEKASAVVLRDSSAKASLRTFVKTLTAPGGVRVKGTVVGAWEDGPWFQLVRVGNPGDSAGVAVASEARWTSTGRQDDNFWRVGFLSTPLLPGRYRLQSWSYVVDAAGRVVGMESLVYTGAGRRPSTDVAKAKLITVGRSGTVDVGLFDMSGR